MGVAVTRSFGWTLGFYDPKWALVQNSQIPIELHFDGGAAVDVFGNAINPTLVVVPMPDNSTLINAFRFAYQMNAIAQGNVFQFNLASTSKLMVQLVDCVRTSLTLESSGSPVLQQPPISATTTQDIILEETRLATSFLLAAQLPGAQIVPQSEVPAQLASYGAVWKAEDAVGAVRIYRPQPGLKELDLASRIIDSDAQSCKGKFVSGRYSELVDADVIVRVVTSCAESAGQTYAQYFIAPQPNGGFVGFSVVNKGVLGQQGASTAQSVGVFEKAALTATGMGSKPETSAPR
jgi:hypothetical protein